MTEAILCDIKLLKTMQVSNAGWKLVYSIATYTQNGQSIEVEEFPRKRCQVVGG